MTSEGVPFVCKSPGRRPFVCRAGTGRRKGIGRAKRHEHGRPIGLECEWRRRLRKGEARSNRLLQNLCTALHPAHIDNPRRKAQAHGQTTILYKSLSFSPPRICRAGTGRRKGIGRARRHEHGRPIGLECEWRRRLRKGEARSNRLLQNLCTALHPAHIDSPRRKAQAHGQTTILYKSLSF